MQGPQVVWNEGAKLSEPSFQIGVMIQEGPQLIVRGIMDGSAGEKGGIQKGDEILSINGIKLSGFPALKGIIGAAGEQELTVRVKRGDQETDMKVTPQKAPIDEPRVNLFNLNSPAAAMPAQEKQVREVRQKLDDLKNRAAVRPSPRQAGGNTSRDAKVEQLLGEILSEVKKMNRREELKSRPPRYVPRIQPQLNRVVPPSQPQAVEPKPVPQRTRRVNPPSPPNPGASNLRPHPPQVREQAPEITPPVEVPAAE